MNKANDDPTSDLKDLWQSTPPVDTDSILRGVRRERRRMQWLLWLEVIGTVIGVSAIWVYDYIGVFGERRWITWLITIVGIGVQVWMWRWRSGLWQAVSQAPLDLLHLQARRAQVSIRIARYYAWGTPIATVLGLLLSLYAVDDGFSLDIEPLTRFVLIGSLLALVAGMTWLGFRMLRRHRARLARINHQIAALTGDNSTDNFR